MNAERSIAALSTLSLTATELAAICEREAPEFGPTWRGIAATADELRSDLSRDGVASLLRAIATLLSHHPGAFTEVYIVRKDATERAIENERFDHVKDKVSAATGELAAAAQEGEVNFGTIRRHLTDLESALLAARSATGVEPIREFLGGDTNDDAAVVLALIQKLESAAWSPEVLPRVTSVLANIRRELSV